MCVCARACVSTICIDATVSGAKAQSKLASYCPVIPAMSNNAADNVDPVEIITETSIAAKVSIDNDNPTKCPATAVPVNISVDTDTADISIPVIFNTDNTDVTVNADTADTPSMSII